MHDQRTVWRYFAPPVRDKKTTRRRPRAASTGGVCVGGFPASLRADNLAPSPSISSSLFGPLSRPEKAVSNWGEFAGEKLIFSQTQFGQSLNPSQKKKKKRQKRPKKRQMTNTQKCNQGQTRHNTVPVQNRGQLAD